MKKLFLFCFVAFMCASCATAVRHYGDTGAVVNFEPSDFEFSAKKSAEATCFRILGIDWVNIFSKKVGIADASVVGASLNPLADNTAAKAAFKLMNENPGYDVIFYPTVESKKLSYIIYSTTTAKVSAKLGRIKK